MRRLDSIIQVEICCGTMCYIMGGADLLLLKEQLPAEWAKKVQIKGVSCTETCLAAQAKRHPLVTIDGTQIENASINKLITHIQSILTNDVL
jgi:NADH:ubiquinone oxidoreductase subunit E